jgi:D-glycero-alpha-D-manno-heptose 1-phosphate guanylyltransferase
MAEIISQQKPVLHSPFKGQAILLAGGLGTRLRNTIPNIPKCMAQVNGRPFLFYVINYLRSQGIENFIFSLGYKHEVIESYLNDQFSTLNFQCSIEKEPLGTGGAILAACYKATDENVLVVNADTLFRASIPDAAEFHFSKNAVCTLLLKPMVNINRYGVVELNDDNRITFFSEKKYYEKGCISGGTYMLNVPGFLKEELPDKFSFEKDYLEKFYKLRPMYGRIEDKYLIDIGTPEDYNQAKEELRTTPVNLKTIDKTWTVFLDRDGVINHEKKEDYIRSWGEFEFYIGAREAIKLITEKCGHVIVVTNQRGVGKGLMTEDELKDVHEKLKASVELVGGRIDAIYTCTSTDTHHPNLKPNPGMAFRAAQDIPGIDLTKSIVAGNKPSDMLFGRNAGVTTVFIASTRPEIELPHPDIDFRFNSLIDFAKAL